MINYTLTILLYPFNFIISYDLKRNHDKLSNYFETASKSPTIRNKRFTNDESTQQYIL